MMWKTLIFIGTVHVPWFHCRPLNLSQYCMCWTNQSPNLQCNISHKNREIFIRIEKTQPHYWLERDHNKDRTKTDLQKEKRKTEGKDNRERLWTNGLTISSPLTRPKAKSFWKCQKRKFQQGIFL
jgi:hypothetical protein